MQIHISPSAKKRSHKHFYELLHSPDMKVVTVTSMLHTFPTLNPFKNTTVCFIVYVQLFLSSEQHSWFRKQV